jgi:DNA polymerase V
MFHPGESLLTSRNDLYSLVAHHKDATFFMRYEGGSNENVPVFNGDILVIDRSLQTKEGSLIVISQDSDFHIRRYSHNNDNKDSNNNGGDENEYEDLQIWGVVSFIIHKTA